VHPAHEQIIRRYDCNQLIGFQETKRRALPEQPSHRESVLVTAPAMPVQPGGTAIRMGMSELAGEDRQQRPSGLRRDFRHGNGSRL